MRIATAIAAILSLLLALAMPGTSPTFAGQAWVPFKKRITTGPKGSGKSSNTSQKNSQKKNSP